MEKLMMHRLLRSHNVIWKQMIGTGNPRRDKIRHSKRSYLGYRSYINQQDRLLRSHIDILEIR